MDANISVKQETLIVSGSLNFTNVKKIWHESLSLFPEKTKFTINLSNVTNSDSAGLCLLIEWLKWAKSKNKVINFIYLPDQLKTMAELAGVKNLL